MCSSDLNFLIYYDLVTNDIEYSFFYDFSEKNDAQIEIDDDESINKNIKQIKEQLEPKKHIDKESKTNSNEINETNDSYADSYTNRFSEVYDTEDNYEHEYENINHVNIKNDQDSPNNKDNHLEHSETTTKYAQLFSR